MEILVIKWVHNFRIFQSHLRILSILRNMCDFDNYFSLKKGSAGKKVGKALS